MRDKPKTLICGTWGHFSKKYGDATTPDKKVNIDEAASQLVTCSVRQQELIVLPYGSC